METKSTLTFKRIIITSVLFFCIPLISYLFDTIISNITISYSLTISIVSFIFIIYNWHLFALHYNRAKKNIGDSIFYTVFGVLVIGLLTFLNQKYIHGYLLLADVETLKKYQAASLLLIFVYSFSFNFSLTIAYKCVVDRIKFAVSTVQVILFSGLFFALLFTIFFVPFNISLMISSFLYYSLLYIFCSYLYNQSGSLIPSIIALTIVFGTLNFLMIL